MPDERPDYIEWGAENAKAEKRRADREAVASLYGPEIRMRVGELIARAMRVADKPKR